MPYFTNRAITPLPVVVTGATWNSADKDADVSLSGGDLVMSVASNDGGVRATGSASSGKKYWEVTLTTFASGSQICFGFANATWSTAVYTGSDVYSAAYLTNGQAFYNGGGVGGAFDAGATGDVVCLALDMDNKKFWFRIDGGDWGGGATAGDPAANTGGYDFTANIGTFTPPYFPAAWIRGGDTATANFGATAYAQTPPAGFSNW